MGVLQQWPPQHRSSRMRSLEYTRAGATAEACDSAWRYNMCVCTHTHTHTHTQAQSHLVCIDCNCSICRYSTCVLRVSLCVLAFFLSRFFLTATAGVLHRIYTLNMIYYSVCLALCGACVCVGVCMCWCACADSGEDKDACILLLIFMYPPPHMHMCRLQRNVHFVVPEQRFRVTHGRDLL